MECSIFDINGDKKEDIVCSDSKEIEKLILLNKQDGLYEKIELVPDSGEAFFVAKDGFYDFSGNYFKNFK